MYRSGSCSTKRIRRRAGASAARPATISKTPNPTVFQKTLGVNDFYFGDGECEYPMGHISFVGKLDAMALSAGAPAIVPGMTLDLMAKHSLDFWLTSEDLPDPDGHGLRLVAR